MYGYCSIAVSEWAEWYLIRTIQACGVQSNPMVLATLANLCWSKDNVMAQAIREVAWKLQTTPKSQ